MTNTSASLIKELNETLKILEKALDQYSRSGLDTYSLIKCIEKITDKIVNLP